MILGMLIYVKTKKNHLILVYSRNIAINISEVHVDEISNHFSRCTVMLLHKVNCYLLAFIDKILIYYACYIIGLEWFTSLTLVTIIQIMHIREVVSKNYSPRGNFIKVWNTRGWKPSVFWIFIKLPRVDNFTNDRSPNVHYLFYKMVLKIWAVVSKN